MHFKEKLKVAGVGEITNEPGGGQKFVNLIFDFRSVLKMAPKK